MKSRRAKPLRSRLVSLLAAMSLLGTGMMAPPVARAARADVGSSIATKPVGPLTSSLGLAPSARAIVLRVSAREDVRDLRVRVRATGANLPFSSRTLGTARALSIPFSLDGNAAAIEAVVEGRDGTGAPLGHLSHLFLGRDGTAVIASDASSETLALISLGNARARDAITPDAYTRAREQIMVVPARSAVRVSRPVTALANVTIAGLVRWADSGGTLHPARNVRVEILDNPPVGGPTLIQAVSADATGAYSWTGDNLRAPGDPRRISVRAFAHNPATFVGPTTGGIWAMTSPVQPAIPDGANVTINLSANDPANQNGHAAFSVADAMITSRDYVGSVAGAPPAKIRTFFPVGGNVSYYSGADNSLNILQLDRFDWDVLHHEYGHYVSNKLYSIAFSPGGNHIITENLADHVDPATGNAYGKDKGIKLAWGEGWPTYFGTSLQQVAGAAALAIPNVGDTNYSDTEDYNPVLQYNLESQAGGASAGEDNELAAQRIVWDIFDATDDAGDQVTMGHAAVWNKLVQIKAKHISDVWKGFTKGKPQVDIEVARLGCIFSEHKVAPAPTAPADKIKAPDDPPTFTWNSNGGGANGRNNKFTVEFYDATFQSKLFTSPVINRAVTDNTGSWTPTVAQWKVILDAGTPVINWVVKGTQTSAPETGEYVGCRRRLIKPKTDLIFVIDVTGSMWDDIGAVKAAASDLVNAIDLAGQDYRVAVVSYRDHPIYPHGDGGDWPFKAVTAFTQDKPTVLAGINSLAVGGGADWPESVYSGLMGAIDATALGGWRNGVRKSIILMGDAPGHDPEPVTGYTLADVVLAAFLADPVQIYSVAVAGCCPTPYDQFQALAEQSSGAYFFASNATQVVGALTDAIERALVAPLADAGPSYYTGRTGRPVQFDAGGSFDVDGEIVTYQWDWNGDGAWDETVTSPLTLHTFTSTYNGKVTLRVTDDDGYQSTDFADVTIVPPDVTPPESRAVLAPGVGAAPVGIPYIAIDPSVPGEVDPTGVAHVELWYRIAPVVREPDQGTLLSGDIDSTLAHTSPWGEWTFAELATDGSAFAFTPPTSGLYELHTIAVDAAGNREAAPPSPDARLLCADAGDGPTCVTAPA